MGEPNLCSVTILTETPRVAGVEEVTTWVGTWSSHSTLGSVITSPCVPASFLLKSLLASVLMSRRLKPVSGAPPFGDRSGGISGRTFPLMPVYSLGTGNSLTGDWRVLEACKIILYSGMINTSTLGQAVGF